MRKFVVVSHLLLINSAASFNDNRHDFFFYGKLSLRIAKPFFIMDICQGENLSRRNLQIFDKESRLLREIQ